MNYEYKNLSTKRKLKRKQYIARVASTKHSHVPHTYIYKKNTYTFYPLSCYEQWKDAEGKNVAVDKWI